MDFVQIKLIEKLVERILNIYYNILPSNILMVFNF